MSSARCDRAIGSIEIIAFSQGLCKNTFMPGSVKIFSVDTIRESLKPLFKEEGLQLVVLFGSAVSGKIHKQSDIDLAILFDKPFDILSITNRVISLLHTDHIDIIDLKHATPLMKFSVSKNGIIIYEKEQGMFNEFCSLAFRMYIDTKKLRDAQVNAIKYFLEARGLS